jgi:predicted DNA-binding protein with PD1-like motif
MTVRAAEFKTGRTFGVTFGHGDEFFSSLKSFCEQHNVKQGYIPLFVGAFENVKVVGTCHKTDPRLPMYDSYVEAEFVETVGAGTIAWDEESNSISPHVHLGIGKRLQGADGITSHLFEGTVQFTIELVVVEVLEPLITRQADRDLYDIKLLTFG